MPLHAFETGHARRLISHDDDDDRAETRFLRHFPATATRFSRPAKCILRLLFSDARHAGL